MKYRSLLVLNDLLPFRTYKSTYLPFTLCNRQSRVVTFLSDVGFNTHLRKGIGPEQQMSGVSESLLTFIIHD